MNIHNYLEKRAERKNKKSLNKKEKALLVGGAAAGLTGAGIEMDALIREMTKKPGRKYPKYLRGATKVLPPALILPALYSAKRRGVFEKKASFRRPTTPGNFTPTSGRQRIYGDGLKVPNTGQQAMPPGSPFSPDQRIAMDRQRRANELARRASEADFDKKLKQQMAEQAQHERNLLSKTHAAKKPPTGMNKFLKKYFGYLF